MSPDHDKHGKVAFPILPNFQPWRTLRFTYMSARTDKTVLPAANERRKSFVSSCCLRSPNRLLLHCSGPAPNPSRAAQANDFSNGQSNRQSRYRDQKHRARCTCRQGLDLGDRLGPRTYSGLPRATLVSQTGLAGGPHVFRVLHVSRNVQRP